jgi:hypothetical protein
MLPAVPSSFSAVVQKTLNPDFSRNSEISMGMGLLDDLAKLFAQEQKEYGTPSRTLHGEDVRSKSEQRIADYFTSNGIRYVYEQGAQTDALIFKRTFAHPDFYLPDYKVYVEYWGLVSASKEYRRIMKWKMKQYRQNKIMFISIYPDNLQNLDWIFRTKFREVVGFDLPPKPRPVPGRATYCFRCGMPVSPPGNFCSRCGTSISNPTH